MELFPHNLKAYNNVLRSWKHSNRTCIIHATGTGKSLIIASLINKYSNSRCLVISPTTYIVKEISQYLLYDNVNFITYKYLHSTMDMLEINQYDFIFLDEFHRIGADNWYNGIHKLLELNSTAKVLGTTATHIRYLDNERNMAQEIFNNNIASTLTLFDAIKQKIHKKPIYVTALYKIDNIINNYTRNIQSSNLKNKKKLLSDLDLKKIQWEKSNGLDVVFNNHLSIDRKKIIVFCNSIDHISETKKLLIPILNNIYKQKINYFSAYSGMKSKTILKTLNNFRDTNEISVMFSVNMFNEGLHIKGVDTVILFRETLSPIIYFQQIGRSFASGQQNEPLIFDLVNNNKSISNAIDVLSIDNNYDLIKKSDNTKTIKRNLIVKLVDKTIDFNTIFYQFEVRNLVWTTFFEKLKDYYNYYNKYPSIDDEPKLYSWVKRQKHSKNINIERKIILLKEFPDFFDEKHNTIEFDKKFDLLKLFFIENNRPPKLSDNKILYSFYTNLSNKYKRGVLDDNILKQCYEISPDIFNNSRDKLWFENYSLLELHYDKFKTLPDAKSQLGKWIRGNKVNYLANELSDVKYNLIKKLYPTFFENQLLLAWNSQFEEFKKYWNTHKQNPSPKESLGYWRAKQRVNFKKGKLAQYYIDQLLSFKDDFFDEYEDVNFLKQINLIKECYTKHNSLPPAKEKLRRWINNFIKLYKDNKLDENKIKIFKAIDSQFFEKYFKKK